MKKTKTTIKLNTYDQNGNSKLETYVWLCDLDNVVKETDLALLVSLGTTCSGLPIEAFIPKSVIVLKEDRATTGVVQHVYVPLYVAKSKGIGWYINDNALPEGYVKYSDSHYHQNKKKQGHCNNCNCCDDNGNNDWSDEEF